ncbi:MAG: hypothetical protein KJO21_05430 [Verrucomicrobiae bacterium]|nr:hypothetical protein [Verrucomicrobiae bacterium]NNJ43163.1 hypothetical protein [Akkermansiaceae bacterium]
MPVSLKNAPQKQISSSNLPCLLFCLILLSGLLHATPNRNVKVYEKVLGTNAESYAVIRKHSDNMGSHYSDHCKFWLDEYSKKDGPGAKPKTTFLLNQNHDLGASDGKASTTTELPENPTPSLSVILSRYSLMGTKIWSQEQIKELDIDHKTGRVAYRSQCLFEAGLVLKQRFPDSHAGYGFSLLSVAEDSNTMLLTISKGMDEDSEERVICVSPSVTQNVRALKKLGPIYLSAGTFKSTKEALDYKRTLDEKKKAPKSEWMVWSVSRAATGKLDYSVVLINSNQFIANSRIPRLKQVEGALLVPIASENFHELIVDETP